LIKLNIFRATAFLVLAVVLFNGSALAQTVAAFDTKAKQAYMIEATTGTVLFPRRKTRSYLRPRSPS
jgi:D-alanyl-D-alanine carboxypeptidase